MKIRRNIFFAFAALVVLTSNDVSGQSRYEPFREKGGSCPPALPVQICTRSCFYDSHCLGIGKCCPTSCGGSVCSRPVTMRQPVTMEKPGSCPATPTGPWVCSSTCTVDSDCKGNAKCCKNRCGALACQKPQVEIVESLEIPVNPEPENPYNVAIYPTMYNIPRNPNFYPYYRFNNN